MVDSIKELGRRGDGGSNSGSRGQFHTVKDYFGLCKSCADHKEPSNIVRLLKACANERNLDKGLKLHAYIQENEFLKKYSSVASTLVSMYARCGALAKAQQVLEELPVRNAITWNALIAGYAQQGQGKEALECFDSMQRDGHAPTAVSFICALKACGSIGAVTKGEQIHDKIASLGMLEKHVILGSTLVDMYARCGALATAQRVLAELPIRNVVMWTALIVGYAQQGQGEEALKCFDSMQCDGHTPDAVTFACALKACGSIGAASKGEQIHERIVSLGMLEKDIVLGNALLDMYARCGALAKAQQVFEGLPVRNMSTWNALITGYTQQGQGEEALRCFDSMQSDGCFPDVVTLTCALKACGSIGASFKGKQIHDNIIGLGMLEKDSLLGNALLDMYSRCGALDKAKEVFAQLPVQDVVAWTALIAGHALQGHIVESANCFEQMQCKGVKPDSTTLFYLLNACSHSGLLDQAENYFSEMSMKYDIEPDSEHYCCMVDLYGRAGKFKNVLDVIKEMPLAYLPVWLALLGACRNWGEVQIGRFAFERARHIDKSDVAIYVCMANIYTAAGMLEDADKIEAMRVANNACTQD